jgi:hypothetical protein
VSGGPRDLLRAAIVALASAAAATPAAAHGFGPRYSLPIPLGFYLIGAGAVVALSFAMVALFLDPARARRDYPRLPLLRSPRAHRIAEALATFARVLSAALLILLPIAGLVGSQSALRNPMPTFFWILWWVGVSFCSALVGDVWSVVNPWDSLFRWFERAYSRVRRGRYPGFGFRYPIWLAFWPAFTLFIAFAWTELAWSGRAVPARLAMVVIAYSAITWVGMLLFGRETWRAQGEVFGIVFGILGRFGPIGAHPQRDGALVLRPYGVGLLDESVRSLSMTALVVAILSTVTFDGLLETPLWGRIDEWILNQPDDSPLWTVLFLTDGGALRLERTIGLALFVLLFLGAYYFFCRLMSIVTVGIASEAGTFSKRFVLTLVPIAIGYQIAHYFAYFALGLQYAIPLLSDPLGWGWDLFGTAHYQIDLTLVGPRLEWYVAVSAVVIGHIFAVYLAHVVAASTFSERRTALRSQIPMLALMVGYTMLSLWILSQPIVETGAAVDMGGAG